ncbi:hypothetical protein BDQ12DRAFT_175003 [Crucibulum laeve]|uniref:Uncharacterized protein n=1 Tax=Crucibulum laeve TaxID=68775 RepID=A0A5C3MQ51_9AGAR|nr:hypothetical protein BDQ12DRAFT_175003 [Crucibulum laeve]
MSTRIRHREDVDKAHEVQKKAAIEGALRGAGIGLGLTIITHYAWPLFRRQTLSFKAFLISGFTISGLVFSAEGALLEHEAIRRREENIIRREARLDLARRGLVGTETEITKWRTAKEQQERERQSEESS